jgi:hypothetical protein
MSAGLGSGSGVPPALAGEQQAKTVASRGSVKFKIVFIPPNIVFFSINPAGYIIFVETNEGE